MSERRRVSPRGIKPAKKPPIDKTVPDKDHTSNSPPKPNRRERRQLELQAKKEEKNKPSPFVSSSVRYAAPSKPPAYALSSLPTLDLTPALLSDFFSSPPAVQTPIHETLTGIEQDLILEPGYSRHENSISCLAWHPDEHFFASGDESGVLKVWEVSSGNLLWSKNLFSDEMDSIYFSGAIITVCSVESDDLYVLDLQTGTELKTLALDEFAGAEKHVYYTEGHDLYWIYAFTQTNGRMSSINVQTGLINTFDILGLKENEHMLAFGVLSVTPCILVCVVSTIYDSADPEFYSEETPFSGNTRLLIVNAATGEIITSSILPDTEDLKVLVDQKKFLVLLYENFLSFSLSDKEFSLTLFQYHPHTQQLEALCTVQADDLPRKMEIYPSNVNTLLWVREGERALLYDIDGYGLEILIKDGSKLECVGRPNLSDTISVSSYLLYKRSDKFPWNVCRFSTSGACALGNGIGDVIVSINNTINIFSLTKNYDMNLYFSSVAYAPANDYCMTIDNSDYAIITLYTLGSAVPVQKHTYQLPGFRQNADHFITNIFWGIKNTIVVVWDNFVQVYTFEQTNPLTLVYTTPILTAYTIISAIMSPQKTVLVLSIKEEVVSAHYPRIALLRLTEPELKLELLDLSKALPSDADLVSIGSTERHLFFIRNFKILLSERTINEPECIDYPLEPAGEKTVLPLQFSSQPVKFSWGYDGHKTSPLLALLYVKTTAILLYTVKEKVWRTISFEVEPVAISFIPRTARLLVLKIDQSFSLLNCETDKEIFKTAPIADSDCDKIQHSKDPRYFYTEGPNNSLVRWKYLF